MASKKPQEPPKELDQDKPVSPPPPPRKDCVSQSTVRRVQRQVGFAAGPWQDGEPPKDGELYLIQYCDGQLSLVAWSEFRNRYQSNYGYDVKAEDIVRYTVINLPNVE